MTSHTLRRQISRIQADIEAIKPKPLETAIAVCEPDPASGEEAQLEYLLALRQAKATHGLVFVGCFNQRDERVGTTVGNVRYCESDFEAKYAVAFRNMCPDEFRSKVLGDIVKPNPVGHWVSDAYD